MAIGTKALPTIPIPNTTIAPDIAASGPAVPALERLRLMSSSQWEDFIYEWTHSLKHSYARVEECGGSGDMGRDIVAYASLTSDDPWDNYQCKHYPHRLAPSDIWDELGKYAYYTFQKEYSFARSYFFVAPFGIGNTLSRLFRKPGDFKNQFIANWDGYCRKGITNTREIELDAPLKAHIDSMDFSIFRGAAPLNIIEEHRGTPWHLARFGGGIRPRADAPAPPAIIAPTETNYVRALFDAYEERTGLSVRDTEDLRGTELGEHFSRSRREFYSAESLREFSRDNVPVGTFERLLQEVHDGVIDVVQAAHPDGYERVLATAKQAKALQLTANALVTRTTTSDRGGMCHQLANDMRIKWRK